MTMTDPTLARIEDHLRRIADALEATGRESRQVDLTEPTAPRWDDCETRDPNQCEPGCARPSLRDGDCVITWPGTATIESDDRHQRAMSDEEAQRILRAGQELGFVAKAAPLDEDDHRPRHDADGKHWEKVGNWWVANEVGYGSWNLAELEHRGLTFCDCDTIEAENGATD